MNLRSLLSALCTLIEIILICTTPVLSQRMIGQVHGGNGWNFDNGWYSVLDSGLTRTFLVPDSLSQGYSAQLFGGYGYTTRFSDGWRLQTSWKKNLLTSLPVYDTAYIDVRYNSGVNDTLTGFSLMFHTSATGWIFIPGALLIRNPEYTRIYFDLSMYKDSTRRIVAVSIVVCIFLQDSIYTGTDLVVDNLVFQDYVLGTKLIDGFGDTVTGIEDQKHIVPTEITLAQNYPNPFNPSTMISYSLPHSADVRLAVYDVLGREVATLVDGYQSGGEHKVPFTATGLASGTYLYKLFVDGRSTITKKMLFLK